MVAVGFFRATGIVDGKCGVWILHTIGYAGCVGGAPASIEIGNAHGESIDGIVNWLWIDSRGVGRYKRIDADSLLPLEKCHGI